MLRKTMRRETPARVAQPSPAAARDLTLEAFGPTPNPQLSSRQILQLQHAIGNQAVQRLIAQAGSASPLIQRDPTKPKPKTPLEKERAKLEQYAGYVQQLVPLEVITEADFKKFTERLESDETEAGLTTMLEAREALKQEKLDGKQRARRTREIEVVFRDLLNADIAIKVNGKIAQLSSETQTAIDASFDGIADPLQKRIYFLTVMPKYFQGKSVDAVISHFKDVKQVTLEGRKPDTFALHATVAQRLTMVAQEMRQLGMPMPDTDIGFGLRDRFNPEDLSSWGLMVHALGIAIDYRATTNQHFKDPLKIMLRDMLIGGPGRLNLPGSKQKRDPNSYASGYQLTIKKMGQQMAASGQLDEAMGAEAKQFFDTFDAELTRLSEASQGLVKQAKDAGITDTLQQGRELLDRRAAQRAKVAGLQKEVARYQAYAGKSIDQATSKREKEGVAKLQAAQQALSDAAAELATLDQQIAQIKGDLSKTFAPWIAMIDQQSAAIEPRLTEYGELPALKNIMEGEQQIAQHQQERERLAQALRDLRIPKLPALRGGKLVPKASKQESKSVGRYLKHFQKQVDRQQYLSAVSQLGPAIAAEAQALERARQAKGGPDQSDADLALAAARAARQEIANAAAGLGRDEQRRLAGPQLSKAQLEGLQRRYATLLSKEPFDATLLKEGESQRDMAQLLLSILDQERQAYARAIGGYQAADKGKTSSNPDAKAAFAAKEEYVKYKRLKELRSRLLNDEAFVFGGEFGMKLDKKTKQMKPNRKLEAGDPSVWQIAEKGFFTPDAEPAGRTSMTTDEWQASIRQKRADRLGSPKAARGASGNEGFNRTFMRLMALYGFDQGAAWHGSQDSMHFELIEMKEKISKP